MTASEVGVLHPRRLVLTGYDAPRPGAGHGPALIDRQPPAHPGYSGAAARREGGLDFLGGGLVKYDTPSLPITGLISPPDIRPWGAEWKHAIREYYAHTLIVGAQGESPAYRGHFLDLDPTYRDAHGQPLLRITFDWRDNERAMVRYLGERLGELLDVMGADHSLALGELPEHFDTASYQSTHNTGGVIIGADPGDSAVNSYLHMWDYHNVFVVGASAFPQNPGYNPTGTVAALAYRAADGIVNKYRHDPGSLV